MRGGDLPVIVNPNLLRGDCLSCARISACQEVTVERVKASHTCTLFTGVQEPVYYARLAMVQAYGEERAIRAMMERDPVLEQALSGEGEGTE